MYFRQPHEHETTSAITEECIFWSSSECYDHEAQVYRFSSPVLGDMKQDTFQICYVFTHKSYKNNKRVLTSSLNIFIWHIETRTTNSHQLAASYEYTIRIKLL